MELLVGEAQCLILLKHSSKKNKNIFFHLLFFTVCIWMDVFIYEDDSTADFHSFPWFESLLWIIRPLEKKKHMFAALICVFAAHVYKPRLAVCHYFFSNRTTPRGSMDLQNKAHCVYFVTQLHVFTQFQATRAVSLLPQHHQGCFCVGSIDNLSHGTKKFQSIFQRKFGALLQLLLWILHRLYCSQQRTPKNIIRK